MMITTEKRTCACGTPYEFEEDSRFSFIPADPEGCADCCEKREKEDEIRRAAFIRKSYTEAATAFMSHFAPSRMLATADDHPSFNRKLWEAVRKWTPTTEKPWLGIIGPTGRCKTRCAYLRVKQAVSDFDDNTRFCPRKGEYQPGFTTRWSVQSISAVEFASAVRLQFSDDKEEARSARKAIDLAHSACWLIIDDLGKCTHTPAVASAFFGLLDERHNENLATIWTANSAPADFLANIARDIADPLRGRLLECSEIIVVK